MEEQIFAELKDLVTESINPNSQDIDRKSTKEILQIINTEDQKVPKEVASEIPYISQAVDIVVAAFKQGGRLFYVGAGTSGRLGVLDAAECPPTFGTHPDMVQGIIAGGYEALIHAQEGIEDMEAQGIKDLEKADFNEKDVACGIAASRRTPYVVAAIKRAREIGAKTIYLTCNPRADLNFDVDVAICPVVGPEVIMGSTRLKAGTATKLVLNMLTTAAMIRMGKVFGNMMVDLQMNSGKLQERAKKTVMMVTGVDYSEATRILQQTDGHVKTALVMILAGVNADIARQRLEKSQGFVRAAV